METAPSFQAHTYRTWARTRPLRKSQQMPKNQHHTDHSLYHHAMQLEFNGQKHFPLHLTTSHSITDAGSEGKLRGAWSPLEAGGRLGAGWCFWTELEHVCDFLFKTGRIAWLWYLASIFRACSVESSLQPTTSGKVARRSLIIRILQVKELTNREEQITYQGAEKNVKGGAETGFMYFDFRLVALPIASAESNSHSSLTRPKGLRAGPKPQGANTRPAGPIQPSTLFYLAPHLFLPRAALNSCLTVKE